MPKNPVYGLADAVGDHFDKAVMRPVRATLDFTERVGKPARELVERGVDAARRFMTPTPPRRRMGDIVLPAQKRTKR